MRRVIICIGLVLAVLTMMAQAIETADFIEIKGKVIDKKSKKALTQSNVYLLGEDIGTVTNNAGEFLLKIPATMESGKLIASSMGYSTAEIRLKNLPGTDLVIPLNETTIVLDELVVRDAKGILKEALARKELNYSQDPSILTAFYREIVRKNKSFIDVSQGVFNIAKSSYVNNQLDLLSLVKGSRSQDYKKADTLVFKVEGGPNTMLLLDLVKNPGLVLDEDVFDFYLYDLKDIQILEEKRNYVISFRPKAVYNVPLYSGDIFVDMQSMAISEVHFSYDASNLERAANQFVKRKPTLAKLKPKKVTYEVKYREIDGVWHLDYVKNELEMKCNWRKKLFNSTFHSVSEMVVTQKNASGERINFDKKTITKRSDIFSEQVSSLNDEAFWGNYTIIRPEEDLRKALVKIDRKKK